MKDILATVSDVHLMNKNVYQVKLMVDNISFIAGQYLMIVLPTGEQVPYSIGSAPHELPDITLYILVADSTSLAAKVIECLKEKKEVSIKMPGGDCHIENGVLDTSVDHILLIAGGTGFSQMKSMYDHLKAQNYTGRVSLYWGLRTPDDVFMEKWITQEKTISSLDVVVNEATPDWNGKTGWLYEAILEDHPDLTHSAAFISGSVGMVYGTLDQLELKGLQNKHCYSDVFAYAPHPSKPAL